MPIDTWTSECSLVSRVRRSNEWKDFEMNWRSRGPDSHRSPTGNYPSCCLPHDHCDLSSVLFVVMCYERNDLVSSTSCHNHYQFPSPSDSDMFQEMTRPFHRSGSVPREDGLTQQAGGRTVPTPAKHLLLPRMKPMASIDVPTTPCALSLVMGSRPVQNHPGTSPPPLEEYTATPSSVPFCWDA